MSDLAPFLQTLRDRLTITEVIRPHVKLVRKGREYLGLCPFHKEKTPSFTVSDEKGFYHCFGCGSHGDIFDFVMKKQNMPFMEAVELLAHLLGLNVPNRSSKSSSELDPPKPDACLYEIMESACQWYQQQLSRTQGAEARAYLEQRGLLPQTIAQFRLGYAPDRGLQEALQQQGYSQNLMLQAGLMGHSEDNRTSYDRFRNRLMFPIWDTKGRVIAFGGRILKKGEPKYLNSPDTPTFIKGKTLYAYHFALPFVRQKEEGISSSLIVVEGYMDVIAMHQQGLKSAVAPLGTALTLEQMALLWRANDEPILCFDGDIAGTRAAHRAAHRAMGSLKIGKTLRFCFLPAGEDPDSLLRNGHEANLQRTFENPQPLVDVLWSIFMQDRKLSTPEQKALARRDLGYLAKEFADPDVRHFYREELNTRLQDLLGKKDRNQNHSTHPIQRPPSLMPGSLPISRTSPNKNRLGYKILLATLINHPTLIEDAVESLTFLGKDAGDYEGLYQALLDIIAGNPTLLASELQDLLLQRCFSSCLEELLTPKVYFHAPFAKETAAREEALIGWREVWQQTVTKHHLTTEALQIAEVVRDQFDKQAWERLKVLKNQVVFKKDEKKGSRVRYGE